MNSCVTSSSARIWRSLRCERIGEPSTIWRACPGAGSKMLHSGPICVCSDITIDSRKLSMGGLVTWANCWRK